MHHWSYGFRGSLALKDQLDQLDYLENLVNLEKMEMMDSLEIKEHLWVCRPFDPTLNISLWFLCSFFLCVVFSPNNLNWCVTLFGIFLFYRVRQENRVQWDQLVLLESRWGNKNEFGLLVETLPKTYTWYRCVFVPCVESNQVSTTTWSNSTQKRCLFHSSIKSTESSNRAEQLSGLGDVILSGGQRRQGGHRWKRIEGSYWTQRWPGGMALFFQNYSDVLIYEFSKVRMFHVV